MYIGAINISSKLEKGEKLGYMTFGVYLAPNTISGYSVCPNATKGCIAACLYASGRAKIDTKIPAARIKRTKMLFEQPDLFHAELRKNLDAAIRKANKDGKKLAARLNCDSDIDPTDFGGLNGVTGVNYLKLYPDVQFYDYTKVFSRMKLMDEYSNYHVTYSHNGLPGNWDKYCRNLLLSGHNVAVVFHKELPETYKGFKVINGDTTDLRFLDEKGVVVGLKYKNVKNQTTVDVLNNQFIIK